MDNPKITKQKDIGVLLQSTISQYEKIEKLYKRSLNKKDIDSILQVKIKNYLENARSILDYCSQDINDFFEIQSEKVYFPIVSKEGNIESFEGSINRNLPGLKTKSIELFEYLESIQPYHNNCSWLADFATVTIDYKHRQLTPQTKIETKRITSTRKDGGSVSWNPDKVKFGSGVFINNGRVDPASQLPASIPSTIVKKEIWVDFKFNNKISVLPLLEKIKDNIPVITKRVYKIIFDAAALLSQ